MFWNLARLYIEVFMGTLSFLASRKPGYSTDPSRHSSPEIWSAWRTDPHLLSLLCCSQRKANWIGHILRRNCLLLRVIEGKIKGGIEVIRRWGRRRRKVLDDLKEKRGYSHLKEEPLDRSIWRALFGRGFEPVVRQTTKWWVNHKEALSLRCLLTTAQIMYESVIDPLVVTTFICYKILRGLEL